MQNERLPSEDELDAPIPELGPSFRRGVLRRAQRERRQRRIGLATLGVVVLAGLSLAAAFRGTMTRPGGAAAPQARWSRALDEDLAWLEEIAARSSESTEARSSELASSSEAPLDYFFPNYQAAASTSTGAN